MEAGEGRVQSAVQSAGCAASSAQSMGEGGRRVGWRVGVGGSAFSDHREIGLSDQISQWCMTCGFLAGA